MYIICLKGFMKHMIIMAYRVEDIFVQTNLVIKYKLYI